MVTDTDTQNKPNKPDTQYRDALMHNIESGLITRLLLPSRYHLGHQIADRALDIKHLPDGSCILIFETTNN